MARTCVLVGVRAAFQRMPSAVVYSVLCWGDGHPQGILPHCTETFLPPLLTGKWYTLVLQPFCIVDCCVLENSQCTRHSYCMLTSPFHGHHLLLPTPFDMLSSQREVSFTCSLTIGISYGCFPMSSWCVLTLCCSVLFVLLKGFPLMEPTFFFTICSHG